MTFAVGSDIESVLLSMPSEPEEWMTTFSEAWAAATEKIMPGFIAKRGAQWAGREEARPPSPRREFTAVRMKLPGGGAGQASAPAGAATNDEILAEQMAGLIVSDHDVPKAIDDINTQGISGARILALSLALMSGHVHPMGDSAELRYASDLRLCPLIRQQRKAGVQSLDDVLKAKNKRELFLH